MQLIGYLVKRLLLEQTQINVNTLKILYLYVAVCGLYDYRNDGYINGRLIEFSDRFKMDSQITLDGQYKNGQKVCRQNFYWKNRKIFK
ncbi:unnamed protein product [Paramecium pentaurelia]|uniref:Uncharacterized protein n=1 Tax=Paramecium pentaurelia TaxID=43138 RepID=A0A8S1YLS2_9CILI|nr:unnamed protein product [Paramecium pentaurelia]